MGLFGVIFSEDVKDSSTDLVCSVLTVLVAKREREGEVGRYFLLRPDLPLFAVLGFHCGLNSSLLRRPY